MILKGVGIGRGVAVGPVLRMAEPLPEPKDEPRDASITAEAENERVTAALNAVNADLNKRAEEAANGDDGQKQAAEILQAVAMFAADPSLAANIKAKVDAGATGERAVLDGFGQVEDMFRAIGGYQGERAADLHDVGQRVIANLMGLPAPGVPESDEPFVLVAKDLSPADTTALDLKKTLAIVTSEGGPTSHTAILCRARGIVAVVSAAEAIDLKDGEQVIVNAAKGEVVTEPTAEQVEEAHEAKAKADKAKELRGQPGQLADGTRIPLLANVGKPSDAKVAHEYGAEGVGLFRTEFLFIGNEQPPSVEEQTKAYAELLSQFPGKKVVIRLLDAGADKPLPFLHPGGRAEPGARPARPAHPRPAQGGPRRPAQGARGRRRPDRRRPVGHGADGRRRVGGRVLHQARQELRPEVRGVHGRGAVHRRDGRQGGAGHRLRVHRHERPDPVHAGRRPYARLRVQLPDRLAPGGAARDQDDL
ncbi:phosphoenolpyruvate-protein phosphotransferase [Bifidobacterium cuniculi]|uniref:Phosphoenolpyruvate-protein phosphotransferase n=1 Tax=Bifidobacterium cuniculi TaxID=1688 RepID=A0A087AWU5_9BIFI|nr:phosphoenolpyruvate-protein phosphotransferase [Bifidobacterium cuniculi]